jgi:hypothetical protein
MTRLTNILLAPLRRLIRAEIVKREYEIAAFVEAGKADRAAWRATRRPIGEGGPRPTAASESQATPPPAQEPFASSDGGRRE